MLGLQRVNVRAMAALRLTALSNSRFSPSSARMGLPLQKRSVQLTPASINPKVMDAQYAVRGALVLRAMQHERALAAKDHTLPFDEIIFCNIGNPHQLNQKPITFFRQVLALTDYPDLLKLPNVESLFPKDAIERAKWLLERTPGGTGAYSESQGLVQIRENVSKFISERDGVESNPDDIFLTDGASQGVSVLVNCLMRNELDGMMIPIPQYPLYTAAISLYGGRAVGYYLKEDASWGMDAKELKRALQEAKSEGTHVRALVVINPGNPTGQTLSEENMREVVKFCEEEDLVLMADEVYQNNVYGERPFVSFRKIYKLFSIGLCANTSGQIMVDLMVKPPVAGDPSYQLYTDEMTELKASLARRSKKLSAALNTMENISCTEINGAMYAFPTVQLPPKAVEAAKKAGMPADTFYAVELLDATGICVVPGSGFRQKPGTFHFRTTILPEESKIDTFINKLKDFNNDFMVRYS